MPNPTKRVHKLNPSRLMIQEKPRRVRSVDFLIFRKFISIDILILSYYIGPVIIPLMMWFSTKPIFRENLKFWIGLMGFSKLSLDS